MILTMLFNRYYIKKIFKNVYTFHWENVLIAYILYAIKNKNNLWTVPYEIILLMIYLCITYLFIMRYLFINLK